MAGVLARKRARHFQGRTLPDHVAIRAAAAAGVRIARIERNGVRTSGGRLERDRTAFDRMSQGFREAGARRIERRYGREAQAIVARPVECACNGVRGLGVSRQVRRVDERHEGGCVGVRAGVDNWHATLVRRWRDPDAEASGYDPARERLAFTRSNTAGQHRRAQRPHDGVTTDAAVPQQLGRHQGRVVHVRRHARRPRRTRAGGPECVGAGHGRRFARREEIEGASACRRDQGLFDAA